MVKIATEGEAASIGRWSSSVIDKKCCTKSRAEALGCNVDGNYADNQLVPRSILSKKYDTVGITINARIEYANSSQKCYPPSGFRSIDDTNDRPTIAIATIESNIFRIGPFIFTSRTGDEEIATKGYIITSPGTYELYVSGKTGEFIIHKV